MWRKWKICVFRRLFFFSCFRDKKYDREEGGGGIDWDEGIDWDGGRIVIVVVREGEEKSRKEDWGGWKVDI